MIKAEFYEVFMRKFLFGIMVVLTLFITLTLYANKKSEYRFPLHEISEGIYVHKEDVVSSIPAQNYSTVTVCKNDGEVITVCGDCFIYYDDINAPHAEVLIYKHLVHSDKIKIYVPEGTVEYGYERLIR